MAEVINEEHPSIQKIYTTLHQWHTEESSDKTVSAQSTYSWLNEDELICSHLFKVFISCQ